MRLSLRAVVASALCLTGVRVAGAQESDKASWPLEVVKRPLTLAAGMAEIGGDTLRVGVSGGEAFDAGEPILLAPELRYGLSGQLQVGITHTNHSFFPPAGICISGEENKCPKLYNAIGAELEYAVSSGDSVDLSARAGATTGRFDPDFALGATAGVEIRFRGGPIAFIVDPNVYIGIIERDTFPFGMADDTHPDYLFLPATLQYQLSTQMAVFLGSGLNTPFADMGDFYQIPAGVGGTYAINNRVDAGLELQFANILGKDSGTVEKFDERYIILRVAIRI
ncbi:MAG TPA: hypothetical protein VFU21_00010 [Kofleriaceae bacterium]|nr:hypothetical protein [Kofleriaceae bacterium]